MMVDRASLDDAGAVAAADPNGMLGAVARLGAQVRRGVEVGRGGGDPVSADVTTILICGVGGSGIAGDVARSLLGGRLPVPILVSKAETLPAFCGPRTLVIAVSYSGNTRETLSCYDAAVRRGAPLVTVSGGGALQERAAAGGGVHLAVPSDVAMPRAALGYLCGALIGWLDRQWSVGAEDDVEAGASRLSDLAQAWSPEVPATANEAKAVAGWLLGRTPVIWGSEGLLEAAALRFKNQINENAKQPAFSAVFPELDHNEVEGWGPGMGEGFAVVALRHDGESAALAARIDATVELVMGSGVAVRQVRVPGTGSFERLFGTILLGDFASVYLGILRGVDPTPVPILTGLKARLAP
jgi:glucose/mannose-6-phosphate isomerase